MQNQKNIYLSNISGIYGLKEKFSKIELPLFGAMISAGFPSPADDYLDQKLDLNEYLISHPASTFFVRVSGESMIGAGINNNDILIVDRSIDAKNGSVVVAVVDGEFTVKTMQRKGHTVILHPQNPDYQPIVVTGENDFSIWGVVTSVIHSVL